MTYFQNFPSTLYKFGDAEPVSATVDITAYVDIIDRFKDNITQYEYYYILEGDRPDQVSQKLYNTPDYYFLFYLFNDNIREQGWPLTERELIEKVQNDYPNTTLTTQTVLTNIMKVGQNITGLGSGLVADIIHRNLDLGQIIVKGTKAFNNNESIIHTGSPTEFAELTGSTAEYNSIAFYRNSDGQRIDINPHSTPSASATPVTYTEHYRELNDNLKSIKIPRATDVADLFNTFQVQMTNGG